MLTYSIDDSDNYYKMKKIQLSYVIRDEEERRHRNGVSSLQYNCKTNMLYSAGRDSIIRVWDCQNATPSYVRSMEHHSDWVNDIVLCEAGNILVSASSDMTVKVWNAIRGEYLATLYSHDDYVKALAYAKYKAIVASAGLDRAIVLWDLNYLKALTSRNNFIREKPVAHGQESIYSLAINNYGTVIAAGGTENIIQLWDARRGGTIMRLEGHSDNIKALLLDENCRYCLSGSSDNTIKLWSLGEKKCITTIRTHDEGVWALLATEDFSHVISGGRDRQIYITDIANTKNRKLVCKESAPILKMVFTPDRKSMWVATAESSLKKWGLPRSERDLHSDWSRCMSEEPEAIIHGAPAIRQVHVFNDKRHVLAKDSDGNVTAYDVLKACKLKDLGQANFDEEVYGISDEVRERIGDTYINNWFKVDLKTGMLQICLGDNCFMAHVSARNSKLLGRYVEDHLVNYGDLVLGALLEYCPYHSQGYFINRTLNQGDHADKAYASFRNHYFAIPNHTPLIIAEEDGRLLYRMLVRETGGVRERDILRRVLPLWAEEKLEKEFKENSENLTKVKSTHSNKEANLKEEMKTNNPTEPSSSEPLSSTDFYDDSDVSDLDEDDDSNCGGDVDDKNKKGRFCYLM